MLCENGKTEEVSRGYNSGNFLDKREGLGSAENSSGIYGFESLGLDKTDCKRKNLTGTTSQPRGSAHGKILERLEFIENSYLNYVQSHQKRLETRLIESKEQEAVFKEAIQALKQEVHNLASNLDQ